MASAASFGLCIGCAVIVSLAGVPAASQLDPSQLGCLVQVVAKNRRLADNSKLGDDGEVSVILSERIRGRALEAQPQNLQASAMLAQLDIARRRHTRRAVQRPNLSLSRASGMGSTTVHP